MTRTLFDDTPAPEATRPAVGDVPDLPFLVEPGSMARFGSFTEAETEAKRLARLSKSVQAIRHVSEGVCAHVSPPDARGMCWVDMTGVGCRYARD